MLKKNKFPFNIILKHYFQEKYMADELTGIIGGTGLGDELFGQIKNIRKKRIETPFGKPSDDIFVGRFGKREIAFINRHGEGHRLGPGEVPYAANIFALKKIGVRTIISTGAVGSLSQKIHPGQLVVVDQFIDKTYKRENSFFKGFGAVHCEMSEPVCPRLRNMIIESGRKIAVKVHPKGTYVCMEGPQFSTRAESLMHKGWGGDLIGMTAMPEAKLAREAQICYAMIALVSDYDCWREHKAADKKTLLQEIISNMNKATKNCMLLLQAVLQRDVQITDNECDCRKALHLAVWTKKEKINKNMKKKIGVLFE
jgi:5'-methylthioadenosine phosphorylase